MLQVLLVDDEPAVTESLLRSINWAALDLKVASVVASGSQALNYMESNPVDIVITDIRMSDMDGLSLCRHVSRINPHIQSIIISGYAEFSYAQKALSYSVIGYCLKPIEYTELTHYLQIAIQKLSQYTPNSNFDNLLDAIHQGKPEKIEQELRNYGFYSKLYYLAVSSSKTPVCRSNQKILAFQLGHKRFAYLFEHPIDPEYFTRNFSKSQCKGFSYCLNPVDISDFASILNKLNNAAFSYFFDPQTVVNTQLSGPKRVPLFPEIKKAVTSQDTPLILSMLYQLKTYPATSFTISSVWNLYELLANSEGYSSFIAVDDVYNAQQLVSHFGSFSSMLDALLERFEQTQLDPSLKISNTTFLNIIKFIDSNLAKNCSLQKLSAEMNMSANYLGQIFKRETGKSFTQYVTEQRIDHAKTMLTQKDMSISDIAVASGFNDYFYFLKTFKRITGVTPKQYRQNKYGNVN